VTAAGTPGETTIHAYQSGSNLHVHPASEIAGSGQGGAIDIIARLAGDKLSQSLGQPLVVE